MEFFAGAGRRASFARLLTTPSASGVSYISMQEQEDWLFRPVLRGMIRGESLMDGSVDLNYISLLNEAIDVEMENQYRFHQSQAMKGKRNV